MKLRAATGTLALFATVAVRSLSAATFIVPADRSLVHEADKIVIASSLASHTVMAEDGLIETITSFSVEETLKGSPVETTLEVAEPGGVYGDRATIIPGIPQFQPGERHVLFLIRTGETWRVLDLAVGTFRFIRDANGTELLVRNEGEIAGWDTDGAVHHEHLRRAAEFLDFVRTEARGGIGTENYVVTDPSARTMIASATAAGRQRSVRAPRENTPHAVAMATYSATSYTFTISGALGGRWNVFPSAVNFYSIGTEPGAPGSGTTAITTAFASWNNDPNSNVNYVYAGSDTSGAHTAGISAADGENTIAFERDLSRYGAPAFQCSANGYSGTLGLGGITNASGTHTGPNGESFATALEGDVEMNKGIANCTLLFNNGDFNSAVTHEVGHTLGFRHSDQTRADDASTACTTDPSLECSDTAIMKSFVTSGLNAALQPWDQHAVSAVYPASSGTAPAAPTGVNARATSTTQVLVTWTAATGATSYEIWRRAAGGSFVKIGTSTTTSYTDTTAAANSAYLYRVRAVSSSGTSVDSASDLATTVLFTDDPLVPATTIIKAVHLAELRTAVNAVRALAGLGGYPFTDAAAPGTIIKAIHVTELRTALDQALSALGLPTGGYTDPALTGVIVKAVHFQELRNRMK